VILIKNLFNLWGRKRFLLYTYGVKNASFCPYTLRETGITRSDSFFPWQNMKLRLGPKCNQLICLPVHFCSLPVWYYVVFLLHGFKFLARVINICLRVLVCVCWGNCMPPVCHTHIRIEASTLYTYTGRMYIISSELWPDHIDSKTACPYKNCHTWLKLSRGAVGPCVPPTGGHPLLIPLPSISTSVYASSSSCILCVWHTLLNGRYKTSDTSSPATRAHTHSCTVDML